MNIGINLLPIRRELTGVGVYAYNIVEQLLQIDKFNRYFIFNNKESDDVFQFNTDNTQVITFPIRAQNVFKRIFWEQFIFPLYLKKYKIDVLFSPSTILPVFSGCYNIICIHDLTPYHVEKKFTKLRSFYVKKMIALSARLADKVLTVSQNTKRELHDLIGISEQKIAITYNGINKLILDSDRSGWIKYKKEKHIPNNYLLYVGTLEPGKNIDALISAFEILKDTYKLPHKLVIAGGKGWMFDSIFQKINNKNLNDQIILTGYVPNEYLRLLYQDSDLFIFPSLYEGFGIPVLEAMYFGVPVIASNTSSLPEVVDNAAKLVDPLDAKMIADTVNQVLLDSKLKSTMQERGFKQAAKFSWKNAAEVTYKELLKFEKNEKANSL
ncbi:MAG: glycosyltransferase [Candidatus Lokiarchaeota archaeon]|nr:glycosyltransferase [Candidatus Lokiarchaeota archaeon]